MVWIYVQITTLFQTAICILQTFCTIYNWYVLNCSYSTTISTPILILLRILSSNNNTAVTKTRHHTHGQPKLVNTLTNCYLY